MTTIDPAVMAFIRPRGLEIPMSGLIGSIPVPDLSRHLAAQQVPARQVLEDAIRPSLARGRCFVGFSGGRDSSAILAVAVNIARREGFADPIPITTVYPEHPETDETVWQELVLEHLQIRERVMVTITDQERLLSGGARRSLRRNGLLAPAACHVQYPILEQVAGDHLLTGEGGDEVLGHRRSTPLALLLHFHRRPSLRLLRENLNAIRPATLDIRQQARELVDGGHAEWLLPGPRWQLCLQIAQEGRQPLGWARSTINMMGRRNSAALLHNYDLVAREYQVTLSHPLLDNEFLRSLAQEGGAWGYAGRTDAMRALFADLLPDALLRRSGKASFTAARFGPVEREFARTWDGCGVDSSLVDVEKLRSHWLSEAPSGTTGVLMHAAWLAREGLDHEGRPL